MSPTHSAPVPVALAVTLIGAVFASCGEAPTKQHPPAAFAGADASAPAPAMSPRPTVRAQPSSPPVTLAKPDIVTSEPDVSVAAEPDAGPADAVVDNVAVIENVAALETKTRIDTLAARKRASAVLKALDGQVTTLTTLGSGDGIKALVGRGADGADAGGIDPFGGALGAGAGGGFVGVAGDGPGGGARLVGGSLSDGELTNRPKPEPKLIGAKAKVDGACDRTAVQRVMRRNFSGLRWCYQELLKTDPSARGRVELSWKILPNGRVASVAATSSSLTEPSLLGCVKRKLNRWRFPAPKDGGVCTASAPVVFKSQ